MSTKAPNKLLDRASRALSTTSLTKFSPKGPGITSYYENAIELSGHGLFNRVAWLCSSLILLHAMLESIAMAYIVTPAECDLNLTVGERSLISISTFLGIMVTAVFWGLMSDRFGRKKVMLPMVFLTIILSLASSFATSFWALFGLRFLVGVAVSATVATVLVYCGEMHTHAKCEVAIAWCEAFFAIAMICIAVIAWGMLPSQWYFYLLGVKIKTWRMFMWLWSIPGLAGGAILFVLPESPRYVLATRGPMEAMPIVAKMYAVNYDKKPEDFPVRMMTSNTTVLRHAQTTDTFRDLKQMFRTPLWRCTWISHSCLFIIYMLANGIYLWMPDLINTVLLSGGKLTICEVIISQYGSRTNTTRLHRSDIVLPLAGGGGCDGTGLSPWMYPLTIIMEIMFLISFVGVSIVIEKYDKKVLYAAFMLPFAMSFMMSSVTPQAGLAVFFLALACSCMGCCSLLTAALVEVFPTSLRSLSMCTMYMMGQLGAAFGGILLSVCLTGLCNFVFFVCFMATVATCWCYYTLWPKKELVRSQMEAREFTY